MLRSRLRFFSPLTRFFSFFFSFFAFFFAFFSLRILSTLALILPIFTGFFNTFSCTACWRLLHMKNNTNVSIEQPCGTLK